MSQPASILAGSAGVKAVSRYFFPVSADSAFSCLRNSAKSRVLLALSSLETWLPACPSAPGHSQSMSKPSKIPAAAPLPPRPLVTGRSPLMYMSMQDFTNFCREASVLATSEKYLLYVQPPIDMRALSFGYLALTFLSWLKLPASGWSQVSPTPSTDSPAPKPFS